MTKCNDIKYVGDKEVVYFKSKTLPRIFCQTDEKVVFILNFLTSLEACAAPPFIEVDINGLVKIELVNEEWEILKENLGLFDIVLEEMKDD
jgi:hypothetical protein